MREKEILDKIEAFVYDLLYAEGTGHDYFHVKRVVRHTKEICEDMQRDNFYPVLLAYLHDVGDYKIHQGEDKTTEYVHKALDGLAVDYNFIESVIQDIQAIGYKGGFNVNTDNIDVWIVQDADKLDAMGAIGIARAFAYGGKQGQLLYNPDSKPACISSIAAYQKSDSPTIQHFYDKLLKLKDLMKTTKGKAMAKERHEFMEHYLNQFYKEWHG